MFYWEKILLLYNVIKIALGTFISNLQTRILFGIIYEIFIALKLYTDTIIH